MTDRLVTLRLTADGRGVAPGVRVANAELDKLGATGQAAGKKAQQGIKGVNEEIERTGRSAGMAETMLKRFLGAAAIAQALVMAGRTADAYADIVGKLRQVTTGERDLAAAKATTFNIAQRYFVTAGSRNGPVFETWGLAGLNAGRSETSIRLTYQY